MTHHLVGKGAVPSPHDPRDLQLAFLAGAPALPDFQAGFRLPEPPDSNQRTADCCVGEATSYFNWQLTGKKFSVRSVFAYIALSYGAYLRDGPTRVVSHGQETFEEAPDPEPKTARNMRSTDGLNPPDALDDRALRMFATGSSPDQLAQAIRDWKGVIFGLTVGRTGWEDLTHPKPPKPNSGGEEHALYAIGYHMHDGQKCIIAKSSWCGAQPGHHEHHIKENYFASGYVFNEAFVLVPKEKIPMVRRYRFEDHGTLGVALKADGSFSYDVFLAKNEEHYQYLLKFYEVPADAPVIRVP